MCELTLEAAGYTDQEAHAMRATYDALHAIPPPPVIHARDWQSLRVPSNDERAANWSWLHRMKGYHRQPVADCPQPDTSFKPLAEAAGRAAHPWAATPHAARPPSSSQADTSSTAQPSGVHA